MKRDAIIGTGSIAIGLFSGVLPPDISQIVVALGGLGSAKSVIEKASKLFQEPDEIRENKHYFLWRAAKQIKASNFIR